MHYSKTHLATKARYSIVLILSSLLLLISLSACTSTHQKEAKKEAVLPTIRVEATELTGGVPGSVIEKNLVTIIIAPEKIMINNKAIKGLKKAREELEKYQKPVITMRAHRCADKNLTTQLMSLAQDHTDTPIPFGSYGSFDDKACKK